MKMRDVMFGITAAILASGCTKVVKDTSPASAPVVEIKVKGADGQYQPATTATMAAASAGQLDFVCIVRDSEGVRSLAINYSGAADGCNLDGAVYSGVFTVTPLPAPAFQELSGDADGKVLQDLPIWASLKGPFSCTVNGQAGVPYEEEIKVNCTGSNWSATNSNKSTTKTLTVKLQ